MPNDIDSFTKCEIRESIGRIQKLLDSGIFGQEHKQNPLVRSAFLETLVCLRDLMYKTEKYNKRVDFDNDILKTDKIKDVTATIKYVRDALCHRDSDKHYIDEGKLASYNIIYGKGRLLKIGNSEQVSDYDDDVCFFFGAQKIYLKRHIVRAFEEAKAKLSSLIGQR